MMPKYTHAAFGGGTRCFRSTMIRDEPVDPRAVAAAVLPPVSADRAFGGAGHDIL
jgi:hypothetical protein